MIMGFLNKVKEFFRSKQQKKVEEKKVEDDSDKEEKTIDAENKHEQTQGVYDIDSSLNKKENEIDELIRGKVDSLYDELSIILEKIEEDVGKLDKVDISKNRADVRLKQITELGQRDYVVAVNRLIENLREEKKREEGVEHINSEINNFMKYSAKSDFKATLLIGKEVEKIRDGIIRIRRLKDNFMRDNVKLIEDKNNLKILLRKNVTKKDNEKTKLEIVKRIEETKQICEEEEKNLKNIGRKMEEIKKSFQYREKERLLSEKKGKGDSLKTIEFEIRKLLDKKLLEKYAYIEADESNKKLAQEYAMNPIKTLLLDEELKILKILEDIIEKVENNMIIVKEANKAIEKINIEKAVFLDYRTSILGLRDETKKIDDEIDKTGINLDDIEKEKIDIEDELIENKNHLVALNKKYVKLQKQISDLNAELNSELNVKV